MPRSAKEIIEDAAELARRFEEYEPRPGDEGRVSPQVRLRLAALKRAEAEKETVEAVRDARTEGVSWDEIGKAVGTSGENARQKYRKLVDA